MRGPYRGGVSSRLGAVLAVLLLANALPQGAAATIATIAEIAPPPSNGSDASSPSAIGGPGRAPDAGLPGTASANLNSNEDAADSRRKFAPDIVLVGFRAGTSRTGMSSSLGAVGTASDALADQAGSGPVRVHLRLGQSVPDAVRTLKRDPSVRYAEPDYLLRTAVTPDDSLYTQGLLWGISGPGGNPVSTFGSRAVEAWAAGQFGNRNVYVGVIDEGMQISHPDLAPNVWTNPFEIAGNGIDDDGNGYVDDLNGWDFRNDDSSVFDGPDLDAHGTHVAGTIGAVGGNGIGVVGVNWAVSIISAKFITGTGTTSNAIRAIDYMVDLKTRHALNIVAINASWGGDAFSQALLDAIDRAGDVGILFVAAAGNDAQDNDSNDSYPANYQCTKGGTRGWDCLVSVAAINVAGAKASFSNYGATSVDLAAPGVDVVSTVPQDGYSSYSGTSMATPHVTGALALLASCRPDLTAAQLRAELLASTTATSSVSGTTVTGGRLNVAGMTSSCTTTGAPRALLTGPTGVVTGSSIPYKAWFNKSVTDLTTADFTIGGTSGGWSLASVSGSGAGPYVITLTAASASNGTLWLTLKSNSVTDGTNLGPAAAVISPKASVDTIAPTATGLALSPATAQAGAGIGVSGTTTDTGGIRSAQVRIDGGVWMGMSPFDGSYGGTSESTRAVIGGTVVSVSAGTDHNCFLMANGTVRCAGSNYYGQLGDGTTTNRATAVSVAGISGAVSIAAGHLHSCALLAGGTVRCWGWNLYGQLGDGSSAVMQVPASVAVSGVSGATAITAGYSHTCALLASGRILCWGSNYAARIGDGTWTDRPLAVAVIGISNAVAVAAGSNSTCALLDDHTVRCWGFGEDGRLGDGGQSAQPRPVGVQGISTAVAITVSQGGHHACALLANGTAKCWGENSYGELGDGTVVNRPLPTAVGGLADATAISAGYGHTCALIDDGTVTCWGLNVVGQLGDGTTADAWQPVPVQGLSNAVAVSANGYNTCALLLGGAVRCWGNNYSGQLGDGTGLDSPLVVTPTGLDQALGVGTHNICIRGIDIAGNQGAATCTSLTVTSDSTKPVAVIGAPAATSNGVDAAFVIGFTETVFGFVGTDMTSAGTATGCAIGPPTGGPSAFRVVVTGCSEGTVTLRVAANSVSDAAGNTGPATLASGGQTIDRSAPSVATPSSSPANPAPGQIFAIRSILTDASGIARAEAEIDGSGWADMSPATGTQFISGGQGAVNFGSDQRATEVVVGGEHACALIVDGTVRCWGENASGQLGNGTTKSRRAPVTAVSGISTAVSVAAGASHTCAVLASGRVDCWGDDYFGQLGTDDLADSSVPVEVTGITTAVAIATGKEHSCALLANGTVRCWGSNYYGYLGNGTHFSSQTPVVVSGLTGAVAIAVGVYRSCAVLGSGGVMCWGEGALGDGVPWFERQWSEVPVAVTGMTNATAIVVGNAFSCALLADSHVACWGVNNWGQLGDGTGSASGTPVAVSGLTDAIALGGSFYHACAAKEDGHAVCWGRNAYGQLGNGTIVNAFDPTPVSSLAGATLISGGFVSSCALLEDGTGRCWGNDGAGELGDGTTTDAVAPVGIVGLRGPLGLGSHDVCVRATDGAGSSSNGTACAVVDIQPDTAPPSAVLTAPSSPTNAAVLTYLLGFDETVSGLAADDFERGGTALNCGILVGGSGASYTVSLSSCSQGTVTLRLKSGSVADASSNPGPSAAVDANLVNVDRTLPTTAWTATPISLRSGVALAAKNLPVTASWTGQDSGGSGIARYELSKSTDGGTTWTVVNSNIAGTTLATTLTAGRTSRLRVRAVDAAGNVGTWATSVATKAVLTQQGAAAITYSGSWTSQTLGSASGGSVRYSSAINASSSITFTGRSVAWVSTLGPTRGLARVYVDGVQQLPIDLFASSVQYARVVFSKTWATAGQHTLRVEVVGTQTRKRVDIDAFLRLS
jgi:alpha-tubulin suppressor-like RCC1 family protein/subtilisin family serine protease